MSLLSLLDKLSDFEHNKKLEIVLASQSIRRKKILDEQILNGRVPFRVVASEFQENHDKSLFAGRETEYVRGYAKEKANDVGDKMASPKYKDFYRLIIGCDTVVVFDKKILEKPSTSSQAYTTLMSFSNRSQTVISGVCLILMVYRDGVASKVAEQDFSCSTEVMFDNLDHEAVRAYVNSGDGSDKAGGYGIQGIAAGFISSIQGCFYNVVGLPVNMLSTRMHQILAEHIDHISQLPSNAFATNEPSVFNLRDKGQITNDERRDELPQTKYKILCQANTDPAIFNLRLNFRDQHVIARAPANCKRSRCVMCCDFCARGTHSGSNKTTRLGRQTSKICGLCRVALCKHCFTMYHTLPKLPYPKCISGSQGAVYHPDLNHMENAEPLLTNVDDGFTTRHLPMTNDVDEHKKKRTRRVAQPARYEEMHGGQSPQKRSK